jgi:hypothetical protein
MTRGNEILNLGNLLLTFQLDPIVGSTFMLVKIKL